MTLRRQLLTTKHTTIDIVTEDALADSHFANPSNFADVVLNQINNDRFMDSIFQGEDLTVLDIGGNIGLFSLFAQDRCKAIYSIEPTPNHFHILKELTKGYSNIHPLNYAVSNENTTIDFYINEENTTMNSINNKYGVKVPVQTKTLKTIIDELGIKHVDFAKCDIEGSEMIALTEQTVGEVKDIVDRWFIEVHATENGSLSIEANRSRIAEVFRNVGYNVQDYRIDGLYISKP
jgi:FkbM family methyltransferase